MGTVTEYKCGNCGLELIDDGRFFYYDDKLHQTIDYMILMSTINLGSDSKIKGRVSETYCGDCKKFVRVYRIREFEYYENPIEIIKNGIKNHVKSLSKEINELIEIKKREKFTIEKNKYGYIIEFVEYDCTCYGPEHTEDTLEEEWTDDVNYKTDE